MSNKIDYQDYNARFKGTYDKIWSQTGKCVFCDLKEKYIIREIDNVVLTVSLFPYINGHLLIIPRRHVESFDELNDLEWKSIKELTNLGINSLKKSKVGYDDFWFTIRTSSGIKAGKTVTHAHAHIIPYSKVLFQLSYQNITYSPIKLAKDLREIIND